MSVDRYLDEFPIVRTNDPEEMRSAVVGSYGGLDFTATTGADFEGHLNYLPLDDLALSFSFCSGAVQFTFPPAAAVRQKFCLLGAGSVTMGAETVEIDPAQSCVISSDTGFRLDLAASEQLVLRINVQALLSKLAALMGSRPLSPVQFASSVSADNQIARNHRTLILQFAELLNTTHAELPSVVLNEIQQTILLSFLYSNPHNFSHRLTAGASDVAPWQVTRVEDYIEAHWRDAITIERLADVANVSARSIFKAFKKSRGYSPMAFARQVRLKHARSILQSPAPSTSVIGVALACGFLNQGHFARYYQQLFGELPSVTLRCAKAHPESRAATPEIQ